MVRPGFLFCCLIGLPPIMGCSNGSETQVVVSPQDGGNEFVLDGSTGVDVQISPLLDASNPDADTVAHSVLVGLYPTPAVVDEEEVEAAEMEAMLASLGAGARVLVLDVRWEKVHNDDYFWIRLGKIGDYLRSNGRNLLLSIATVEALKDTRPSSLQSPGWSLSSQGEMKKTVDRIYDTLGLELAYLSLGMEVDRFLSSQASESAAFSTWMEAVLNYARNHPNKPDGLNVGLTWTLSSWKTEDTNRDRLVQASDVVMVAHYGLNLFHRVQEPTEAANEIVTFVDSMTSHPVVLHRIGYSSSDLLGGNEGKQASFIKDLFTLVHERRNRIPMAAVVGLHDPYPTSCLEFAQARGGSSSTELYAFWCSTGLRTWDGTPKQAFSQFLQSSAQLGNP